MNSIIKACCSLYTAIPLTLHNYQHPLFYIKLQMFVSLKKTVPLVCSHPVQRPPLGHVLSPGWQQASVCESAAGERRESEGFPAGRGNSLRALQTAAQLHLSTQAGQAGPQRLRPQEESLPHQGSSSLRARRDDLHDSCV